MEVIRSAAALRRRTDQWRRQGLRVGLVPTMGALHEGHASLVRWAGRECDRVVVSIFVNPLQFGPGEDFKKYPRTLSRDLRLLRSVRTDAVWVPASDRLVGKTGEETLIVPPAQLTDTLCGAFRPGHFTGVATIVAKLFHAVSPHRAYFGQKDAQQCAVIRRMIDDLKWPVDMRVGPTVREEDGLAMSSRNAYLSFRQRNQAPALFQALKAGERAAKSGLRSAGPLAGLVKRRLAAAGGFRVQYAAVVDPDTLRPLTRVRGRVMIAVAAYLGGTRLIDNHIFRVP